MERGDEDILPLRRDDPLPHPAYNLDPGPDVLEERRPDEHPGERPVEPFDVEVRLERVNLTPEAVSLDERVHEPEQGLAPARRRRGGEDHPGARPPHGAALVEIAPHPVEQARLGHLLPDNGRLAPWYDQAGEPLKILDRAHLDRLDPELLQYLDVLPHVALQREHTHARGTVLLPVGLSDG